MLLLALCQSLNSVVVGLAKVPFTTSKRQGFLEKPTTDSAAPGGSTPTLILLRGT